VQIDPDGGVVAFLNEWSEADEVLELAQDETRQARIIDTAVEFVHQYMKAGADAARAAIPFDRLARYGDTRTTRVCIPGVTACRGYFGRGAEAYEYDVYVDIDALRVRRVELHPAGTMENGEPPRTTREAEAALGSADEIANAVLQQVLGRKVADYENVEYERWASTVPGEADIKVLLEAEREREDVTIALTDEGEVCTLMPYGIWGAGVAGEPARRIDESTPEGKALRENCEAAARAFAAQWLPGDEEYAVYTVDTHPDNDGMCVYESGDGREAMGFMRFVPDGKGEISHYIVLYVELETQKVVCVRQQMTYMDVGLSDGIDALWSVWGGNG
jgi:hypothetical protein